MEQQTEISRDLKKARKVDWPEFAKVSLHEAIEAASQAVPGTVIDAELDESKGNLVYKIQIVSREKILHKVKIDASNKQIIRMKTKGH